MPYALLLSLAFVVFNLSISIMAGPYIVSDLGGSTTLSVYGLSFFCLGNLLGVSFGKPNMTRFSPVQLFLLCLFLMGLFSFGTASATTYLAFVVSRFFEGLVSGPLLLLILTAMIPLVLDSREPGQELRFTSFFKKFSRTQPSGDENRAQLFLRRHARQTFDDKTLILALAMIIYSATPLLGASWGGVLAYFSHWRLIFYINVLITLIFLLYLTPRLVKYHRPTQTPLPFDRIEYALLFIGVFFLGTALITGQQFDWFRSIWITWLIFIGGLCCVLFGFRTWSSENPLINLKLLKNSFFIFAMVNLAILMSVYFGNIMLLASWLKLYVNYTPNWIAVLLCISAIGGWIPVFLSYEVFDLRIALGIALILFLSACFYTTQFNVETDFYRIALSRALIGLATPMLIHSLFRITVHTYPIDQTADCANIYHIVRVLFSGVGAALYDIMWQRRQVFFAERLGSQLTEFSQNTTQFFEHAFQFHLTQKQALTQLQIYLTRQSTALALDDCFYFMGWSMVGLVIVYTISFIYHFNRPIRDYA